MMSRSPPILIVALILSGCASSARIDTSEDYRGRHGAAVSPVADHRIGGPHDGGRTAAEVQRGIRHTLNRAAVFEGVQTLERRGDENEAEVIIQPSLTGTRTDPALKVRVVEKSSGREVLDQQYPAVGGDSFQGAIATLEEDLEDVYRDRTRVF